VFTLLEEKRGRKEGRSKEKGDPSSPAQLRTTRRTFRTFEGEGEVRGKAIPYWRDRNGEKKERE